MLKWSETDLTEFFGVLPTFDDDALSHSFEVSRDGLRLLITIFELEHAVCVSIFRDGLPEPVMSIRRKPCSHAHITQGTCFRRCFEFGATKFPVTDMGIPPVLTSGVRIYIEPQFQVELLESQDENF